MIKLFRKIRRHIITENKVSKYLIYSIGEIVLVVIGILIALQVNNWNGNRAKFKEQNIIIENLNLELNSNLTNINEAIIKGETVINSSEQILLSMNGSTRNKYQGEKLDSILSLLGTSRWHRSDLYVESIQSSGSLNNENHRELKTLIYDWVNQIKNLEFLEKKCDYAFQYYIDYIKKNGSWREIDKYMLTHVKGSQLLDSNDHLLTSPEFENCLNDLFIWETHKKRRYKEIKKSLIRLIELTAS